MSYGPVTARTLQARWQLSAVSGIGLIHSCCNMNVVMPQVYDKVSMRADSIPWNFHNYTPEVVTICLGQNDGIQDSVAFCNVYVRFLDRLRKYYPAATLICLTSPMAEPALVTVQQQYLKAIVQLQHMKGDDNVQFYFFSKRYYHGCDSHPDMQEHAAMAAELSAYVKVLKKW